MSKKSVWTERMSAEDKADFEAWKLTVNEPNTPETEAWLSCTDGEFFDLDGSEFRTETLH